jgi:hypothetical protein
MKIRQWSGYNVDASQYLLRGGELRVLNNLQSRRPGMLLARKGMSKIYGKYDDEGIYGLYRRSTILGNPSDFLWLQKVLVARELTAAQIASQEYPFEFKWMIVRAQGNQSRVIDTQNLSPNGSSTITNFSVAEDRHGRIFMFYGHGARPRLYRPGSIANVTVNMGLDPPTIAPSVNPTGSGYFIEAVDVKSGGGSYYAPPTLTITGGTPTRPAVLKPIVQYGNVVGVDVVDGGSGYDTPPTITASMDTIGVGFRGRGNVSTTAKTMEGFSDTATAVVTGTAATTATETYGTTNGTTDNSILYESAASTVSSVKASYDTTARRFYANIPLRSTVGQGAYATLEFSPKPLGYGLDTTNLSSTSVAITNLFKSYLYGEYWEGSDYDDVGSAENSRYGGLQASASQYVLGYSGSVNGRSADVYWPDYSAISVWVCTGVYSSNINQWKRITAPVKAQYDSNGNVTARYIEFDVPATAKAKTIKSLGASVLSTAYQQYDTLPDAVPPRVKMYLQDCPDSWITSGDQCLPTSVKETSANFNHLQWWSPSSGVTRPVVGLSPSGTTLAASHVTITNAGSGWQQNTLFAFRIYQANPYAQVVDYNTAVKEPSLAGAHGFYSATNYYAEIRLTANTPDNLTPHGPPSVLTSSGVTIPGVGYTSGSTGFVKLYKRALSSLTSTQAAAQTLTWTASILDTLSSAATGQIASVTVVKKGNNYYTEPTIQVRGGGTGYGLAVKPTIVNGQITSVQIIDSGMSYTTPPELYTAAQAAQLTPVMRPAMRGIYRCAYRYVDMSETVVKTVTATLGDSATTLTLSDTTGVEPDMILDASALPYWSKIKTVNGNQVEINQTITGLSSGTTITVKVRDLTKPIGYSDFSPITDVDAGPNDARTHSSVMEWALNGVRPAARADKIELWRTSADQSLVFYRLDMYGVPSDSGATLVGTDTLTDEELFNPNRAHYAAMPVVLPNGNVNAFRFGTPRSDMSVAVAFQDRLWCGVSTSGEGANTLYFSNYDEFEGFPDVNELPIQINQKSTDVLTALVPFGSMLLAIQNSHTYAVTYNTDPTIDGAIQMLTHRGALHQRCWDIHDNVLYVADEAGIYSVDRSGNVDPISMPLRDFFVSELIDFSKRETFFLQTDPRTHILRFFCTLKSNSTDTPAIALCYDIQAKTWWTESYPNSFTCACTGRPAAARVQTILLGAVDGNIYEITSDSDHANDTLTDCFVVEGGSGYREAPEITCPNVEGAVLQGVVSEGRLVDVVIQSSGWSADGGLLIAAEDGRILTTHDERELGGVEYWPIKLTIGSPEPGGVQATAYANFSVTPRVVRECTVAEGESFVRLDLARTAQLQPLTLSPLAAETGGVLFTQNSRPITCQPPPVEIGMEAIGDWIPLNSFVSKIDGRDIYLEHPDGTPALLTNGNPRTNAVGTSTDYLENGGSYLTVTFRKPYRTHIPFRMATGFMQIVNESNAQKGGGLIDRSVSLVYTPTEYDKTVEIIERFNGREEMRPNLIRRDRGGPGSFSHGQDSASTVLNISKTASALGFATGVAKAKFASQANSDLTGTDQHLQVELYARPEQASPWKRTNFWVPDTVPTPQPFVMHEMTVNGVVEDAQ